MSYNEIQRLQIINERLLNENNKLKELAVSQYNTLIINNNNLAELNKKNETILNENEDLQDKYYCKICYTKNKNIVVEPCCHFISCRECSEKFTNCPICRCPIETRLILF
jgi:hypothetical protein